MKIDLDVSIEENAGMSLLTISRKTVVLSRVQLTTMGITDAKRSENRQAFAVAFLSAMDAAVQQEFKKQ